MNLSLKQLRAFLAVAESGSFTQASRRLSVTQSALSLLVKDLESEIGFRLLDRTTRRVELSAAGREFQPMAQKVLDELQSVIRSAAEVAMVQRGVVRVGATEAVACTLVAPAIAAYQDAKPTIDVRLVDTLVHSMLVPLRNHEVDYVIGPASLTGTGLDASIVGTPLFESPFSLFCLPSHPLGKRRGIGWKDVMTYPLIVPSVDFTSRFVPQLREQLGDKALERALDGALRQIRQVSNVITGLSLAAAGLGGMVAPQYIAPLAQNFGLVGHALGKPLIKRTVSVYSRKGQALSPSAQDFLAFVRHLVVERGLKVV